MVKESPENADVIKDTVCWGFDSSLVVGSTCRSWIARWQYGVVLDTLSADALCPALCNNEAYAPI